MRPFLVVLLTVAVLGGTKWFIDSHQPVDDGPSLQLIQAPGDFTVEVTLSFDAGPDEFSLDETDAPSLLLQLNGVEVLRRADTIPAEESPLRIQSVDGLVVGRNEFYLEVSPADTSSIQPRAVRVRVFKDGTPIAKETLWPEPGDVIQGTIALEVVSESEDESDDEEAGT